MDDKDFFGSEKSVTIEGATEVSIEFVGKDGAKKTLKPAFALQDKEIIDASVMNKAALVAFFEKEIASAKEQGVLLSLHMKATMMKVSDPVIFGHAVKVYYKDVFAKHGQLFNELGVDVNNGIGDVYAKIAALPQDQKQAIEADLQAVYETQPPLAMVDSDRGITTVSYTHLTLPTSV